MGPEKEGKGSSSWCVHVAAEAAYVTVASGPSKLSPQRQGLLSKVLVGHCYLRSTFPVRGRGPKEGYF